MRALMQRLSALDADAENAVRIITLFDKLVQQRSGLTGLVRSAAVFSECAVGATDAIGRVAARAGSDGSPLDGTKPATATTHPVDGGGQVWLERSGPSLPLDDIVLERFAAAVAIIRERQLAALPRLGDPALVELLISEASGEPERARAIHLIGLTPATRVRVLAVEGSADDVLPHSADVLGHAPVQGLHALVVLGGDLPDAMLARCARVGVGPLARADEAWQSWHGARLAVRFTADGEPDQHGRRGLHVIHWDDLGGLAALAEHVPTDTISQIPDVVALDRLAAERTGMVTILALQVACQTESLRRAATALHMHHSSVAARLARAEEALGFSIRTAIGRNRLMIALVLRHLRDNDHAQPPVGMTRSNYRSSPAAGETTPRGR